MSVDLYTCEMCGEVRHADEFSGPRCTAHRHDVCKNCYRTSGFARIPYDDPRVNGEDEMPPELCPLCAKGGTEVDRLAAENARLREALVTISLSDSTSPHAAAFARAALRDAGTGEICPACGAVGTMVIMCAKCETCRP
jgi:hypothetical protein